MNIFITNIFRFNHYSYFSTCLYCKRFIYTDEYHQSFVAGRGPSIRDVCIDSIGIFFGIMLVRIICWTLLAPSRAIQRRRRRKQKYRSIHR